MEEARITAEPIVKAADKNSDSQETSDDVMPAIAQAISKVTGTVYAEEVPLKSREHTGAAAWIQAMA